MSLVFRSEQFLGFLKRSPLKNPPQATYRWYQCYIKTVTIFEHCQIERLPDIDILAWFSGRRFLHSNSVFIRRWRWWWCWWWWSELGSRRFATDLLINVRYKLEDIVAPARAIWFSSMLVECWLRLVIKLSLLALLDTLYDVPKTLNKWTDIFTARWMTFSGPRISALRSVDL